MKRFAFAVCALLLAACKDSPTAPNAPVLSSLAVAVVPSAIRVGESAQATATGRDQFSAVIAAGDVVWTSTAGASISATGAVTGIAPGEATIVGSVGNILARAVITISALPAARLVVSAPPIVAVPNRTPLVNQPSVQLVDANGSAVKQSGVAVLASLTGVGSLVGSTTATTDNLGIAHFTNLEVHGATGLKTITFTASGLESVAWTFTLGAGPAARIEIVSGANQTGISGNPLPVPLSVLVTDADANPISNAPVTFAVASGAGTLVGATTATNASGIATLGSWTLGAPGSNAVVASTPGVAGLVTFNAVATPDQTAVLTTLQVTVSPATIAVGGTATASVVGKDQFGAAIATGPVTWSANGAATITQSGVITAVSAGQATITASAGGRTGATVLTVQSNPNPTLTSLRLTAPSSIIVGQSTQIGVVGLDQSGNTIATGPLQFFSDPIAVAVITQAGMLTGISAGQTTVSVKAGSLIASTTVAVTALTPVVRLTLNASPFNAKSDTPLSTQPVAQLLDMVTGQPIRVAGTIVTATLISGAGILTGSTTAATDANGTARFTDLTFSGPGLNKTILFSAPGSNTVTWAIYVTGGAPAAIVPLAGNNQTAPSGRLLLNQVAVMVIDRFGTGVSGVPVTFAVASGGGTITIPTFTTDANGGARVGSWRLGAVGTNTLTASTANGVTGTVTATATVPLAACGAPTLLTIGIAQFGKLAPSLCELRLNGGSLSNAFSYVFSGPEADGGKFYDSYAIDIPAGMGIQFEGSYDFASSYPDIFAFDNTGVPAGNGTFSFGGKPIVRNRSATTRRFQIIVISEDDSPGGFYNFTPKLIP